MTEKTVRIAVDEYPLGERVRYFRKRRKLTQKVVASKVGISQGCQAQIEMGQCTPSLDTLKGLSRVLDVNIATLFSGEEVLVFDMKKLKKSYKKESDLSPYLRDGLLRVVKYAESIGLKAQNPALNER